MFVFPRLTEIETQIKALQAEAEKVREVSNIADAALNKIADTNSQLQDLSVSEEELIIWRNKVVDVVSIIAPLTVQVSTESRKRVEKENAELKQEIQNLKVRLEEFSKNDTVEKLQQQLKEERTRFADKIEEVSNKFFTMEQENKTLKNLVEETIVNPDIEKLRSEKENLANSLHEYKCKYLDAVGDIKLLKTKLGEDDEQAQGQHPQRQQAFDVTPVIPKKFRVGDLVKVVGELHQGQVGRIVNTELSLLKVAIPIGTLAYEAKDLAFVVEEGGEDNKQISESPKVEEINTGEPTTCNEQEIEEFLKGLVKSKKARANLTWESIRKVARRDTNFFRIIQLMRKTARQSEVFSELHNSRFADLLVKHIESTGDRSDFDWIPNRLKKQVESRIVNAPEQLTMLIA
ncbi:MAG: hypothetical protein WBF90_32945 [Rivularia sp. (in: cyanobacteria)]